MSHAGDQLPDDIARVLYRVRTIGLMAGAGGAVVCAIAAVWAPTYFFPAYLVGWLFWLGIALGCLALALLQNLTGGGWGMAIRRVAEAGYSTLPLLAVAFLPLLAGLAVLYPWARPDVVAVDPLLQYKARYLNVGFFAIRAALYFAFWIGMATVLSWLSSGTNVSDERLRRRRLSLLSGPALILWTLTITFAMVDWGMSIEPHWFSSIYPVIFMAGQAVSGMSFCIMTVLLLRRSHRPTAEIATGNRIHDLGNFLLAFVLVWTYMSFTQYLIIWSGNLPEEAPWYLHRSAGAWKLLVAALMLLHFAAPFLLLLIRQTKRKPRRLFAVCGLLLAMRLVDLYWNIVPTFSPGGLFVNFMIFVTPVAIGGFWLAMFAWRLPARIALPVYEAPKDDEEERHELAQHTS